MESSLFPVVGVLWFLKDLIGKIIWEQNGLENAENSSIDRPIPRLVITATSIGRERMIQMIM